MREVVWKDDDGYKHRSLIRDDDPDSKAQMGLPMDPPDLDQLDWDGIKRDLHNMLVERGLCSWDDIRVSGNGIRSVIQTVLKRRLIALYRQDQMNGQKGG